MKESIKNNTYFLAFKKFRGNNAIKNKINAKISANMIYTGQCPIRSSNDLPGGLRKV